MVLLFRSKIMGTLLFVRSQIVILRLGFLFVKTKAATSSLQQYNFNEECL